MRKGQPHPCKLPPGEAALRQHLRNYRFNAKKRSHEWALSDEKARKLVNSNCHYCDQPPEMEAKVYYKGGRKATPYTCNGLDRVDNSQGYTEENTVPCCKKCNIAKNKMHLDEFKSMIKACYRKMFCE